MIQEGAWQETLTLTAKLTQTLTRQVLNSLDDGQGRWRPLSLSGQRIWLAALTGLMLFIINGRLVLAAAAGLGSFKLLNWLNQKDWLPVKRLFQQSLNSVKSPLTLTPISMAGVSAVAALGVYMAASIIIETESYWTAMGAILQGLLTIAILCLLIWQMADRGVEPSPQSFDLEQPLTDLTHPDPLKRLIAVRRMTRLATQTEPEQMYIGETQLSLRSHVTDCFRIMLHQEPEAIVRAAIRESLLLVNPKSQLPKGAQPLAALNRAAGQVRSGRQLQRHQVEYVEP